MQLPPTAALEHLIKHFLVIDVDDIPYRNLRMFSDGNTGMVFNYKDPILIRQHNTPAASLPSSFFYGPFHHFQDLTATGKIGILVVVFHPFAISSLLKTQATSLIDQVLDLEDIYFQEAVDLSDQIHHAQTNLTRIALIEDFLLKKMADFKPANSNALQAVRLIQQGNGDMPVRVILSSLQISERKLERVFQEYVGYSPKKFAGITRIQYFLKLLRQNRPANYTGLVYEAGFFDQAHLIRTMKNISGLTPGEYLDQPKLLAANFLEIPL
ncbi:helix-turn-helix domain-containing protein [Dyadobacter sp. CY312]|uniref:AraC family transcriptional regulator n=1 Tax=Dyadobacter sp. CY312 TaxID=2907303 RepID=UPI001F203EF0|nr:helix-turn-helix domain-containing protein [Dyadobacter sp. CY312]MCE7043154.1 helix-turn-helix domain-containing protein [Dyadobacter sp. CY312]